MWERWLEGGLDINVAAHADNVIDSEKNNCQHVYQSVHMAELFSPTARCRITNLQVTKTCEKSWNKRLIYYYRICCYRIVSSIATCIDTRTGRLHLDHKIGKLSDVASFKQYKHSSDVAPRIEIIIIIIILISILAVSTDSTQLHLRPMNSRICEALPASRPTYRQSYGIWTNNNNNKTRFTRTSSVVQPLMPKASVWSTKLFAATLCNGVQFISFAVHLQRWPPIVHRTVWWIK
jgi:hypothetical protein